MVRSRAEKAGRLLVRAIIELVHLMYQKNTATNFMKGLCDVLGIEADRRFKDKPKTRLVKTDKVIRGGR